MPAPIRLPVRPVARQRGSVLAQWAIVLASIGAIALVAVQVVRH